MIMKNAYYFILILSLLLAGCSSQKKLEATAPFILGEVYAQKWIVENAAKDSGYEVVIPLMSLDEHDAVLQNLYHKRKMVRLSIEIRKIGMIALAEYSKEDVLKRTFWVQNFLKRRERRIL